MNKNITRDEIAEFINIEFGLSKKDLDMIKVYQEITENDTKKLTKD